MRNVRLWVAYDGTGFAGWQRQAGAATIQELLEDAVALLTGERVTLHGAGRTDSGVHALCQSAHFRSEAGLPADRFAPALNTFLPAAIRVLGSAVVPDDFHARFSARAKRYLYRIRWGPVTSPIGQHYFHHERRPLDVAAMRAAGRLLIGQHDFLAFANNPGHQRKRPTVRTIQALHLPRRRDGVDLVVQGDGFLYNMVRTLAGTLLLVGRGLQPPPWVGAVLQSCDRKTAGPTLPADGLFLIRVLYPRQLEPRLGLRCRAFF